MRDLHDEEDIACGECGSTNVNPVPMEGSEHSRFRFEITHRRDGSPIKNLDTKGAFLGIVEIASCNDCGEQFLVMDDLVDRSEEWAKLPAWSQSN